MKLKAETLGAALSRKLAPIYVIAGDEPLLAGEAAQAVRAAARDRGFSERESWFVERLSDFDWQDFLAGFATMSLFGEKKLIELRLPGGKPGRDGAAALQQLSSKISADNLFMLHLPYLNKKAQSGQWVRSLQQAGVWVDIYPPTDLLAWLSSRAQRAGLDCEPDAIRTLAERVEGNLLAAQQELDKLALLVPDARVDRATVIHSVANGARYDVFQLTDAALAQNLQRAVRILAALRREGAAPALVVWSLVSAVRVLADVWAQRESGESLAMAFQNARIWGQREALYRQALDRHGERSVRQLMTQAAAADRIVKGAQAGVPWAALHQLVVQLAHPAATSGQTP